MKFRCEILNVFIISYTVNMPSLSSQLGSDCLVILDWQNPILKRCYITKLDPHVWQWSYSFFGGWHEIGGANGVIGATQWGFFYCKL